MILENLITIKSIVYPFQDCGKHLKWNECKGACWDPACSTVCRHGTQCCLGSNGRYSYCQKDCPISVVTVAGCKRGFKKDNSKQKCVKTWTKRIVV